MAIVHMDTTIYGPPMNHRFFGFKRGHHLDFCGPSTSASCSPVHAVLHAVPQTLRNTSPWRRGDVARPGGSPWRMGQSIGIPWVKPAMTGKKHLGWSRFPVDFPLHQPKGGPSMAVRAVETSRFHRKLKRFRKTWAQRGTAALPRRLGILRLSFI